MHELRPSQADAEGRNKTNKLEAAAFHLGQNRRQHQNPHQHVSRVAPNTAKADDNNQRIPDALETLFEEKAVARKKLFLELWRDFARYWRCLRRGGRGGSEGTRDETAWCL